LADREDFEALEAVDEENKQRVLDLLRVFVVAACCYYYYYFFFFGICSQYL